MKSLQDIVDKLAKEKGKKPARHGIQYDGLGGQELIILWDDASKDHYPIEREVEAQPRIDPTPKSAKPIKRAQNRGT